MDGIRVGGDGNMSDKVERGHLERGGISGTCKKKPDAREPPRKPLE